MKIWSGPKYEYLWMEDSQKDMCLWIPAGSYYHYGEVVSRQIARTLHDNRDKIKEFYERLSNNLESGEFALENLVISISPVDLMDGDNGDFMQMVGQAPMMYYDLTVVRREIFNGEEINGSVGRLYFWSEEVEVEEIE